MEGDDDQYGVADLRQYITGSKPFFRPAPPPQDLLSTHRGLAPPNQYYPYYDMPVFTTTTSAVTVNNINSAEFAAHLHGGGGGGLMSGTFQMGSGGLNGSGDGGADGVSVRWPRQETLILLEIRSRLDSKFKEANQKGPLWDEVSRIMSEEHGYQRSGKKCREKFENLYKYYKKTKEGKAGRQDGKHYRFFRQLEAIYGGETSNSANYPAPESHFLGGNFQHSFPDNSISLANNQENSLASLSNLSDSEANTSDYNADCNIELQENKKRGKRRWKSKIIDFIDGQMRRLMEKQEAWMEKMMNTIEHKEKERMMREEQWRRQDAARIDREHKLWASERAWIEARDAALMEAFHKLAGNDQLIRADHIKSPSENSSKADVWPDCETTRLIQLRTGMEAKFLQVNGISEQVLLWEEIASRMCSFGHERSGVMCKDKWEIVVNDYLLKCNKKRRDDLNGFYQNVDQPICSTVGLNNHGNNVSPSNEAGNVVSDSCYRYFIGDA